MLIVIEGLDGAGKRTLTRGLQQAFEADGRSVTTLAFPRYGESIQRRPRQRGLARLPARRPRRIRLRHGRPVRARPGRGQGTHRHAVHRLRRRHPGRYVASNAAYSAARLSRAAPARWCRGGWGSSSTAGSGCPSLTARSCSTRRWSWPPSGPGSAREQEAERARDAYERDDADCSSEPARSMPNWPPRIGAALVDHRARHRPR